MCDHDPLLHYNYYILALTLIKWIAFHTLVWICCTYNYIKKTIIIDDCFLNYHSSLTMFEKIVSINNVRCFMVAIITQKSHAVGIEIELKQLLLLLSFFLSKLSKKTVYPFLT